MGTYFGRKKKGARGDGSISLSKGGEDRKAELNARPLRKFRGGGHFGKGGQLP